MNCTAQVAITPELFDNDNASQAGLNDIAAEIEKLEEQMTKLVDMKQQLKAMLGPSTPTVEIDKKISATEADITGKKDTRKAIVEGLGESSKGGSIISRIERGYVLCGPTHRNHSI